MAAMDIRRPAEQRDSPPACKLPEAGEIATACSAHETVSAPGYVPPDTDENGEPIDPRPLPVYEVRSLHCAFTAPERNKAECHFDLRTPTDRQWRERTIPFEYRFFPDHGPAHHLYYTFWTAKKRCSAGTG